MKKTEAGGTDTNLRVVAAVIEALKKETSSALNSGTADLFDRLSSELRRCAERREQV